MLFNCFMTPSNKLFGRISYKAIFVSLWVLVFIGLIGMTWLFVYVANNKMPDTSELENPKFEESSIVYASDGVEIDRYFQRNRQWVNYEEISQNLIDALIATEDHRFFQHSGIDAKGTARAFAFLGSRGGASTITQQLAKQFFTEKRSSAFFKRVWQKMQEWVIAVEFERRYTKEELLAMFLNKFGFNYQANGIGSAANVFFNKDQKELTVPEAALLIGMLKNPSYYSPINAPERALSRRNVVLAQMKKNGFLDEVAYQEFKAEPLDMTRFNRGENFNGMAPHFMSELKKHVKNLLQSRNITKPGGAPYDLDTDGLEIYTTIDSRYQMHAEKAAREHMKAQQAAFERVWKSRDPWMYLEDEGDLSESEAARLRRIRDNTLTDLVEQSQRYRKLRSGFLDKTVQQIGAEIPDTRLWNGDINRLLNAEKDPEYLDELIDKDFISKDQKKVYDLVLESRHWPTLKEKWEQLRTKAIADFNEKRKMAVYTYDGPVVKEMTPLDSIKYMANFLQIGSVSMDPKTGHIKTWVGGSDYDFWKYDHVTTNRQVGSTFKPFLYTAAINNAISPCWKVRDMQYTIPAKEPPFNLMKTWEPKNTRGAFTDERVTLKEGLKQSLNSVSVYLVKYLESIEPVISIAEDMGIEKGKIPPYPSIVLGSPSLNVLEMTTAYSTFANNGISVKPIFIEKIVHRGVTIFEDQTEQRRTIPEDVNYAMVELLKYATGHLGYLLKTDFGGKTGTTNDHVDGWFMGITPELVTGTWVGGQYNWVRFLSLNEGQGSRMARPFFINYMQGIESDPSIAFNTEAQFYVPTDTIQVNCAKYDQLENEEEALDDEFELKDDRSVGN